MHLKKLIPIIASYPATVATAHYILYKYGETLYGRKGPTTNDYKQLLLYAFLVPGFVLMQMLQHTNTNNDPMMVTDNKRKAMYPEVDKEYLSDKPDGIMFGKYKNKYVRMPIKKDNIVHGVIVGAPGSGKSASVYLTFLLSNFYPRICKQGNKKDGKRTTKLRPPITVFVNDIKPELAVKSVEVLGNDYVKVCNPVDRKSWGWNVYYELNPNSSEDEVIRVLDGISRALIVSNNPKDQFFVNGGRSLFKGLMCYNFFQKRGFIDSINEILTQDIQTYIKDVLKKTKPESKIYSLLNKYASKTSDAMQDVELTLTENLSIFTSNEDVKFCMRDSGRMATPRDLLKGISIFLSLPEKRLDEMKDVFRLINYQVLHEMENKPDGSRPVCLLLDEFGRIGKVEKILDSLATARSRCVSIWIAIQDISQLESVYGKEDARTIINLCEVTCVLSCRDIPTCNQITDWAGQYREMKTSVKNAGEHKGEGTTSPEYRDICTTQDIMRLKRKKEVIVFLEGIYYRIKRLRYYEDPVLNERHKEVVKYNNQIKRRKNV